VTSPAIAIGRSATTVSYPSAWLYAVEVAFVSPAPPSEDQLVVEGSPEVVLNSENPITLNDSVLFASGSAVISAHASAVLDALAAAAVEGLLDGQRMRIDGHVDEIGSVAYNERLAADRAFAVAQRFIRIRPDLEGRIDAVGHGESELLNPLCRGDCPENRVVVISITG